MISKVPNQLFSWLGTYYYIALYGSSMILLIKGVRMPYIPEPEGFNLRSVFNGSTVSNALSKDNTVLDKDWIKSRFMVSDEDLDDDIQLIRFDTLSYLKYTNTSIGGHKYVNPRPQFNPLTDPKLENPFGGTTKPTLDPNLGMDLGSGKGGYANTGMGEGYSRLIDDNQQIVYLEFGLPKFNSLIDFFFRAVDYNDSVLANTGRPATAYIIGQTVGVALGILAFPILSATVYVAKLALLALNTDASLKFYYFDAKMAMYWSTVNTLVTQLVTEKGVLKPIISDPGGSDQVGALATLSSSDVDNLNSMIPGLIAEGTNYIDVFAMVSKTQRVESAHKAAIYRKLEDGIINNEDPAILDNYPSSDISKEMNTTVSYGAFMSKINKIDFTKGDPVIKKPVNTKEDAISKDAKFNVDNTTGTYKINSNADKDKLLQKGVDTMSTTIKQGGAYAAFAVDFTGTSSESFSSSVTNISLGEKAKAISSRSRSLTYDLARANFLGDDLGGDAVKAAKDALMGVADGVTFGLSNVITSLLGNAYVELPKRWEDSSMTFQQQSYTMQLIAPYNTFVCQLQNIYMPLCMLLAGTLPLATGKSSYTSPFLCTLFSRGVTSVPLGMITELSVTRGTSNLGFDKNRNALAIDVSFTVTDFSTLVTTPVNSSIFQEIFTPTMQDDTPLGIYMSILGGRDIHSSKYSTKRPDSKLTQAFTKLEKTFSFDRMTYVLGATLDHTLGTNISSRDLPVNLK